MVLNSGKFFNKIQKLCLSENEWNERETNSERKRTNIEKKEERMKWDMKIKCENGIHRRHHELKLHKGIERQEKTFNIMQSLSIMHLSPFVAQHADRLHLLSERMV